MIYSLNQIKDKIIPAAQKYELANVYLFGFYARNEAREDSDVDLLIDRLKGGFRNVNTIIITR